MCHVLVICNQELKDKDEKKEFQAKKRSEIIRQKPNPVIQFVYGTDKKAERTKKKYLQKHPRAIIQEIDIAS